MTALTTQQRDLLQAILDVEAASGTPHAQAIATATGLRVDQAETALRELAGEGLVAIEGIGAQQQAWESQPAYRLTDVARAAIERG